MYEVEIDDLIATQEKIAHALSTALSSSLRPVPPMARRSVDKTAYQLYLKGRYGCDKRDRSGLAKCSEYLAKSLIADPDFAPSHAALAEAQVLMALYGEAHPREVMPRARTESMHALRSDPELPDAHTAHALVKALYEWDLLSFA
jgi:hypothetical protein